MVKPAVRAKKRSLPRKGIIMTLVAFGVLGGLFFALSQQTQPKQSNLLGEHTYIAKDGGDNSGPGSTESGKNESSDDVERNDEDTSDSSEATEVEVETEVEHETPEPTKQPEPTRVKPTEASRRFEPTRRPSPTKVPSVTRIPKEERTGQGNIIPTLQEEKRELKVGEGKSILLKKEPEKTEMHFENKNGAIEIKKKTEDGTNETVSETEVEETLKNIDEELQIKPGAGDSLTISKGETTAHTKLKLVMNADSGKLGVEILGETKDINILPDQAVNTLKSSSVIDEVSGATPVTLGLTDNQPSFQIEGAKTKKIFGLIPVKISKKVIVSADTGNIISEDTSTMDKILSVISL